ncbi:MAG: gamma-glutamyl-gamma-aminobutyrate hydrolase family protein [Thaumarchaeota archaeon]|nr:gamma-glutamyl-gamma-aminobutyrate hydrolase family protein [Nitrososphaerota archaeon]
MSDVLVIQNTKNEGVAALGNLLEQDGLSITTVLAKKEKIPSVNPQVLIILGAPESANDNLPYLRDELVLIQDAVKNNIPVLGICLGSQLVAKAFGARVYPGKKKEIGFYHDVEFDNTSKSKLFQGMQNPATVFHWHGDTFDLPEGAVRLAHSKDYQNQAIKIGSAIGVQFHLEVDEPTIRLWLEKSKEELRSSPHIRVQEIIEDMPKNLGVVQNNMKTFYRNFKSEFNL